MTSASSTSEGYLRITDRKKDLIKTSGGKYVAPQKVEGVLKAACPYISQVVVHGEGRKYISALITLDPEAIAEWAASHGPRLDLGRGLVDQPRGARADGRLRRRRPTASSNAGRRSSGSRSCRAS